MIYETGKLAGGVQLVAAPMSERRSVAMGIWVHVGGRHEEPRLNGVSHFLEHIVFKGTRRRTAAKIKESVEGVGGSLNAFTSEELTCFLAKASTRHFEAVLDVLADMVLDASLDPADIEKERAVILEEIKMTQDQPANYVEELLTEALWAGHPLGRPLTGTLETVGNLSRADIASYRDAFYRPNLITVSASGDVGIDRLTRAVGASFGAARSPASPGPLALFGSKLERSALKLHDKATEQTHLALGFHTFPKEHPDEFVLDILSVVLGGNMSSRLFNEVREERGLAYDIGSSVRKYHETGAFVIAAGVDNRKVCEAIDVVRSELDRAARQPVGDDELARAKEFYLGQLDLGLENSMNNMLWAGESAVTLGRCRAPEEVIRAVERVGPRDLRRVAEEILQRRVPALAVVGPEALRLEAPLKAALAR